MQKNLSNRFNVYDLQKLEELLLEQLDFESLNKKSGDLWDRGLHVAVPSLLVSLNQPSISTATPTVSMPKPTEELIQLVKKITNKETFFVRFFFDGANLINITIEDA